MGCVAQWRVHYQHWQNFTMLWFLFVYFRYFWLKVFRSKFEKEDQRISQWNIKLKTLERLEEIKFTLNGPPQADILIMLLRNTTTVIVII